jgi:Cu/Ag efflux pump CusA
LVPSGNQWNGFRGTTSFARLVRKFALQTVPEWLKFFGGFEKQYQLVLDPLKMQYYNVSMMEVMKPVTMM